MTMDDDPSLPFRAGDRLGRYELLFPLAQGGMAVVWLARLRGGRGFEKLVAVKTIRPHFGADDRFERMFLDEAAIASKIHHPNVAQTLELGEHEGTLYLVMEWVEGESLARVQRLLRKRGHPFPLAMCLRIVADMCAALHAAHELRGDDGRLLGVVHRDVSPQNVIVSFSGSVKVIDFGIAKARNRASAETTEGVIKGKIPYLAPEQARGLPLDRAVDIWATGVCLYQLLTGELPFDDDTPQAVLQKILTNAPPPPMPPAIPSSVHALVDRALDPQSDRRFATAADMQKAIESCLMELSAVVTSEDVATYLSTHLADLIADRRKRTAEGIRAAQTKIDGGDAVTLASSELHTVETASAVSRATTAMRPRAPRRAWWVAAIVLSVVGASAAIALTRGPAAHPTAASAEPSIAPKPSAEVVPSSSASVLASTPAPPPSASASTPSPIAKPQKTAPAPAKTLSPAGKDYGF